MPEVAPRLGRGGWPWRIGFSAALTVAALSIPVLAFIGRDAILDSSDGQVFDPVTDPSAPDYHELVSTTPTVLLIQRDTERGVVGVTFLSLPNDDVATVLFIPPTTTVQIDGRPTAIRDAWSARGVAGVTEAVEVLLGVGIADFDQRGELRDGTVEVLDDTRWAQLVEPLGVLTFENPDEVIDRSADEPIRFDAGPLDLEAADVGSYLRARNADESDLNRMLRHEALWTAWLDALRSSGDPGAIPGETDAGLGHFLDVLRSGEGTMAVLPASAYSFIGATEDLFLADVEALGPIVAAMVPFPTSPSPGARATLRVLDGTGTPGVVWEVVGDLIAAGAELRAVGNGPSFDYVGTQILYYREEFEAQAQAMRDALGAGTLELRPDDQELVMVTVILGSDVVAGLGGTGG